MSGPPTQLTTSSFWLHLPGDASYVFGAPANSTTESLQKFDMKSMNWQTIPLVGTMPAKPGIAAINQDTAYVFEQQLYAFDVRTNQWSAANGSFTDARTDANMWITKTQAKLLLFGGKIGAQILSDTWIYDFDKNEWTHETDSGPSQRWAGLPLGISTLILHLGPADLAVFANGS